LSYVISYSDVGYDVFYFYLYLFLITFPPFCDRVRSAYLQALASPPAVFSSPTSSKTAIIKPYDGPDAQAVIQAVNARTHGNNGSRGHNHRSSASINGLPGRKPQHGISTSMSAGSLASIPDVASPISALPRDHSPTLPNVPAHPTLSSLINLSLPSETGEILIPPQSSAAIPIVAPDSISNSNSTHPETQSTPPRIGDPGRRMVGHALGIRHPSLTSNRPSSSPSQLGPGGNTPNVGIDQSIRQVQQAMSGLSVAEE